VDAGAGGCVKTTIFDLPVHPAADVFPMLPDEELDDLVADIKAHGLLQPIIVKAGALIDGRNRREACRRAGVEPRVEELNGTDPVAYILAVNVNRRHLTKGQRAMAVAKLYPEPEHLRRKGSGSIKNIELASAQYISHARTVLRWLPEIADHVLAGTTPLNEAYAEAQRLKEQADAEPLRLTRLRQHAPDLAELVDEGRMRLTEAESAHATRLEDVRRQRQANLDILNGLERMFVVFADERQRRDFVESLTVEDRYRARTLLRPWISNLTATVEDLS
jgi:hypothetical protein